MKSISSILIILFLVSACAPVLDHIPRNTEIVGFDFSKYSEKGFLITPGEYGEDYETLGLLTFRIYPEAKKMKHSVGEEWPILEPGWIYLGGNDKQKTTRWAMEVIDPSEAIEMAYQEAIKRNADAITHLEIHFDSKTYPDGAGFVEITAARRP